MDFIVVLALALYTREWGPWPRTIDVDHLRKVYCFRVSAETSNGFCGMEQVNAVVLEDHEGNEGQDRNRGGGEQADCQTREYTFPGSEAAIFATWSAMTTSNDSPLEHLTRHLEKPEVLAHGSHAVSEAALQAAKSVFDSGMYMSYVSCSFADV